MSYNLRTSMTWAATLDDLEKTFRKWGISDWTVIPARIDSRKSWWSETERKVTIIFRPRIGVEQQFSLASQDRPIDDLRALYLGLEAIRMNEVRGIADVVREMYLQLSAPATKRDPYEILAVRPDAPIEVAEASYKALARSLHPDSGGDNERMKELNVAIERIRGERK